METEQILQIMIYLTFGLIFALFFSIYTSIQLQKLFATMFMFDWCVYIPIVNYYILGKIVEKYANNYKLIGGYTKYILIITPCFLLVKNIGLLFFVLGYIYLIYCRILLIKSIDNRIQNYFWAIVLPGKLYKNCFATILMS